MASSRNILCVPVAERSLQEGNTDLIDRIRIAAKIRAETTDTGWKTAIQKQLVL